MERGDVRHVVWPFELDADVFSAGEKMSIDQEEDDKLRNRIRTFQDSASLLCADEKGTGPLRQRPGN